MKFKSNIEIQAGVEAGGSAGSNGQILSSTGTGVAWINQSTVVPSAESAESVHIAVKNTSGAQILKGTPVYVTGETGNSGKIEVAPADASDSAKMPALGLLESTLSNNAEGFCVQGGLLEGLATATIDGTATTANDTVYVKSGGGLTMTKPTGTGLIQNIAKVVRVHASNGTLVVSSILRTNDVPNLTTGKIWVGDGNTTESTVVHLDEVNGRMGIGTTDPSTALDINGVVTATGGNSTQWNTAYTDRNKWDGGATGLVAATGRTSLGLGALATLNSVDAATITDNSVGAVELNVSGNGTTAQYLRSDGDGTFTWATPTNTTYGVATDTALGLIELFSNTDQTVAANAVTTTANRTYGLQLNSSNQAVINVPWTDNNTTYTAGVGLTLAGTEFSHADTSSQASVDNSNGIVIQDVTLDTYGHVTGLASVNLDGRYYTESEADSRFFNVAGDTVTGDATFNGTTFWRVSAGDAASQRTDSRDDATNFSRLHWYGLTDAGVTSNFRHAWYDGTSYITVTANASGRIDFSGSAATMYIGSDRVFDDGYHPNADAWTTARTITIGNTGKSVSGSANVSWSLAEIGAQAALTNPITGTGTTNYLPKFTGSTTLGNSLVFDNGTNVGIGTTSPDNKLSVAGNIQATNNGVDISDNSDWPTNIIIGNSVYPAYIKAHRYTGSYSNGLDFYYSDASSGNSTLGIRLNSSGNVGIGTNNPGAKLEVYGSSPNILINNTDETDSGIVFTDAQAGTTQMAAIKFNSSDEKLKFFVNDEAAQRMVIDTSGNVGIGTNSPGAKLDIINSSLGIMFRLSNTEANATTKYGAILGRHYTNAEENVTGMLITSNSSTTGGAVSIGGGISAANAVNNVIFYTAANNTTLTGTERMRITSTGNVGIGTTDPSAKLEVIGDAPTYTNASTIFWGGTTNNDSYNGIMLSSFGDALGGSLASNLLYSNSNTPTQTNTNRSSGQIKFENTTIASKTSDINFGGYYKGTTTFIERMRINSDGNVGIGTTDPSQKLDVNGRVRIGDVNYSYGGQNFHIVLAEDTQDAYITNVEGYGIMSAGGYYYGGNLRQLNSNSTAYSAIHLRTNGDTVFENITGATAGSTASANQRMIINSLGNVGIGTNSPSSIGGNITTLDIRGSSGGGVRSGVSGGSESTFFTIAAGGYLGTISNIPLYFQTNNSVKATILANGNFGIGTTGPGAKFHVNGTGLFSDNTSINAEGKYFQTSGSFIWGGSTTVGVRMGTDGVAGLIDFRRWLGSGTLHHVAAVRQVLGGSNRYGLGFLANDLSTNSLATTVRMYIDPNSGYIGIGTDSPDYPLHVVRNIANFDVGLFVGNQRAYGLGDFSGGALYLGKEESGGNQVMGAVIGRPESQDNSTIGTLIFQTRTSGAPTEKMRISSSGNVGIGTTSPGATLDVNVTGNNTALKLTRDAGANGVFDIDFDGANTNFNSLYAYTFQTGNTERMRITSGGNVGIGTTSPTYKLQLSTNSAAKPTSNVWTVVSDSRVKENIRTYDSGLDKVLQIEPKLFDYNGKAGFEKTKDNVGIIAQEIKKILPETVNTYKAKLNEGDEEETELYSYDGHALTFALVNSIKELNKKIEQLETKIQTLENKQI